MKRIIMLGGGDHARVLLDILLGQDIPVAGIADIFKQKEAA